MEIARNCWKKKKQRRGIREWKMELREEIWSYKIGGERFVGEVSRAASVVLLSLGSGLSNVCFEILFWSGEIWGFLYPSFCSAGVYIVATDWEMSEWLLCPYRFCPFERGFFCLLLFLCLERRRISALLTKLKENFIIRNYLLLIILNYTLTF